MVFGSIVCCRRSFVRSFCFPGLLAVIFDLFLCYAVGIIIIILKPLFVIVTLKVDFISSFLLCLSIL